MKKSKWWVKLLIALGVVILIIFFGAVAFNLLAWCFDIIKICVGWMATALRWLGRTFDFFGFAGVFTANADASVATQSIEILKQILRIGG